jgi:hypothetical protein
MVSGFCDIFGNFSSSLCIWDPRPADLFTPISALPLLLLSPAPSEVLNEIEFTKLA